LLVPSWTSSISAPRLAMRCAPAVGLGLQRVFPSASALRGSSRTASGSAPRIAASPVAVSSYAAPSWESPGQGAVHNSAQVLPAARRVLEVVVPLVYRPAMKAAFLDLGTAGTTAKVLQVSGCGQLCMRGELCDALRADHSPATANIKIQATGLWSLQLEEASFLS